MPDCAEAARAAVPAKGAACSRTLLVIADDYGIGPATSRAILELGVCGKITGSVLLVNSPFAEEAITAWRAAGEPMELGWHPCLTLDQPILPPRQVPSLVNRAGQFWRLRQFLCRWALGRLRVAEIAAELRAQYDRFIEVVGRAPTFVNSHQHVQLFAPIGEVLLDLLSRQRPLPYLRRVVESWSMLACVPGAWVKRSCLTRLGRRHAVQQSARGFPGNDALAGITNPYWVHDPHYLERWLTQARGAVVELVCHPGYFDETLVGRDCRRNDGLQRRRVQELNLLRHSNLSALCRRLGLRPVPPSTMLGVEE